MKVDCTVTYTDLMLGIERSRGFDSIDQALEFIRFRALMYDLYNNFKFNVTPQGEQNEGI